MQTRSQTHEDPEAMTTVNPLPEEIRLAHIQNKTLGVCFRNLPKVSIVHPKNLEISSRRIIFRIEGLERETKNTTNW